MNRTTLLLLVAVLLGAGAYLTLRGSSEERKLADKDTSRQFAYPETDDVHRIFVADRNGHQVTLTRGGISGWLADGRPANEHIMNNVLQAIRYVDVQSLPSYQAVPNMVKDIATSGILIQLFDEAGTKLRGYYLGGSNNQETGTYAIIEGAEDPYVVHLPGFTGNIRQRFVHWGDEWRDKVYFRVRPERVERFSIEYPKQRNKSFELTRNDAGFQLRPFYESGQQIRNVPAAGVEGVLAKFEKYYVNNYENRDAEAIARAKASLPFAVIRVKEEGKEERAMEIYPRYEEESYTHNVKTGEVISSGGLRAYSAFINGGTDWVLLNVETLQPLLVSYDHF